MKRLLVYLLLATIFSGIGYIFWYTDLKYSLPTPVPKDYHLVKQGTYVDLAGKLPVEQNKPVFIHFFNPECPCSRFNMAHFKSLVKKYKDRVSFSIVVLNKNKTYTEKEIQDKFDLDIPVSFDYSIADRCGVYSTPQAVLLNTNHSIYYRGNYNKSRYCTNKNSNYAQIALDSLLNNNSLTGIDKSAFVAYGCQLPTCKK